MVTNRIEIYNNLKADWQFTVGNKNIESFNAGKLNVNAERKLHDFCGIEYILKVGDGEDLDSVYLQSLFNFFQKFNKKFYFFTSEYDAKAKSKFRSYKGLLKKEIPISSDANEIEIILNNGFSIFASIVQLNESNFEHCISNYFTNSDITFISNSLKLSDQNFIEGIIKTNIDENGILTLDYLDLLLYKIADTGFILRNGGFYERSRPSFQIFVTKKEKDSIVNKLTALDTSS